MKACILLCILLHLSSTFQASHFTLMTSVQSRVIACTFAKFVQNLCNFSFFLLGYQLASSGKCSSANTVYRVDKKTLAILKHVSWLQPSLSTHSKSGTTPHTRLLKCFVLITLCCKTELQVPSCSFIIATSLFLHLKLQFSGGRDKGGRVATPTSFSKFDSYDMKTF